MKTLRRLSILIITTSVVLLSACAKTDAPGAANPAGDDTIARGREQLIRAFDAGWVRFVAKGGALAVLKTEPPNKPGASLDYMVRLADCLPHPELVRFPESPVGRDSYAFPPSIKSHARNDSARPLACYGTTPARYDPRAKHR